MNVTEKHTAIPCLGTERLDIELEEADLFDFFLYHAYSKLSGFLTNILGLAVFLLGVFSYLYGTVNVWQFGLYALTSIGFIAFTPWQLKRKAHQAAKQGIHAMRISLTDWDGIFVEKQASVQFYAWTSVQRAAVTPKTLVLYLENVEALVIPKRSLGVRFGNVYRLIAVNLGRSHYLKTLAGKAEKEKCEVGERSSL